MSAPKCIVKAECPDCAGMSPLGQNNCPRCNNTGYVSIAAVDEVDNQHARLKQRYGTDRPQSIAHWWSK